MRNPFSTGSAARKFLRSLNPIGSAEAMVIGPEGAGPAEKKDLERAKQYQKQGLDPLAIQKQTGWFYDPNLKVWGKEISDKTYEPNEVRIRHFQDMSEKLDDIFSWNEVPRNKLAPFQELDQRYPQSAKTPVRGTSTANSKPGLQAFYLAKDDSLEDPGSFGLVSGTKEPAKYMHHELQHQVDDLEGGALNVKSLADEGVSPFQQYKMKPSEIRARVTEQRRKFTDIERARYPYSQHLEVETARSMNPSSNTVYESQDDIDATIERLRNLGVSAEARDEIVRKILPEGVSYEGAGVGSYPDQPGKQRHWRTGAGSRTWAELEQERARKLRNLGNRK